MRRNWLMVFISLLAVFRLDLIQAEPAAPAGNVGWQLQAAFSPYGEKATVAAVFTAAPLRSQAVSLKVGIVSDQGFKGTATLPVKNGTASPATIPIPGLPAGQYTVTGEVMDASGQPASIQMLTYQRKVFPWEHNTLGLSRRVLQPWVPMELDKVGNLRLWGREFTLALSGLPVQLKSQEIALLGEPCYWVVDKKELRGQTPGRSQFTEVAQDRMTWRGVQELKPGLQVEVAGLAEFDGYIWLDLTLIPAGPVKLESLELVIPLKDTAATMLHFQGGDGTGFNGKVPAGDGVVYRSLQHQSPLAGGFSPFVWLGNAKVGLSWFADAAAGWAIAADQPAQELRRRPGRVDLVLRIISRPVELTKRQTISCGLMATPVKPFLPMKNLLDRSEAWLGADGRTALQPCLAAPYPVNLDYVGADKVMVAMAPGQDGVRFGFSREHVGWTLPEVAVFDGEWGGLAPAPHRPGAVAGFSGNAGEIIDRELTDSRIDMLVYYVAEMARKTCLAGTSWNDRGIASVAHPENLGLDQPSVTFDIRRNRQFYKRIATAWQEIRKAPDNMAIHTSSHIGLPFYTFAAEMRNDTWAKPDPTQLNPDGTQKDFLDLFSPEKLVAETVPSQFGIWVNLDSNFNLKDPADAAAKRRMERSAQALGGLHNLFTGPTPVLGPRETLQFIGYWDEKNRVITTNAMLKASLWRKEDSFELIIVNLSATELTEEVLIPVDTFDLHCIHQIWDAETNDFFDALNQETFKITVKPHDYRHIRVDMF